MKYLWLCLAAFLLLGLTACNSDTPTDINTTDTENRSLDTSFCVHLNERSIIEMLEISVYTDGTVLGGGGSNPSKAGEAYRIDLKGERIAADKLKLKLSYFGEGDSLSARSFEETWVKEGPKWVVQDRPEVSTQPQYWVIRCPGDTTEQAGLYDMVWGFNEGYAVVERSKKFGLINQAGELILPLSYANLSDVVEGTMTYQNEPGQAYGLVSVDGTELTGATYSQLLPKNEGLIAYFDNEAGAWGFMDSKLEVVIQPRFSQINMYAEDYTVLPFNEGLANVAIAGRWGYINRAGEEVIPLKYSFAGPFEEGKARVSTGQKWFYINKQGDCVEDCD